MSVERLARGRRSGGCAPSVVLAAVLLLNSPCALALNPALDVSQYAHSAWPVRGGSFRGTVVAMAQTHDGYLWLGTEFGLVRFDGVNYLSWQPAAGQHLPNDSIGALLAARDGTLWIGAAEGFAAWKDDKLTLYAELRGQSVRMLFEDSEGTVWAGGQSDGPIAELCDIRKGAVECDGKAGEFGRYIDWMYEDRAHNLWVASSKGLWRWKGGTRQLYPMPDRVQTIMEDDSGGLVLTMLSGSRRFSGGQLSMYTLPGGSKFAARSMLRDRNGGLWIGTRDQGLVHVHQGRADVFARPDGLSGDFVESFFEDREGGIWVATLDGLDHFRELAVPTISVKQGLSNATVESVLAAHDGSIWLGTLDGLNHWDNGRITVYRKNGLPDDAIQSLFEDYRNRLWVVTRRGLAFMEKGLFTPVPQVPGDVQCITGDTAGNLWVSQRENLIHLRDGTVVDRIPWARLGRPDAARSVVMDPAGGGVWLGFIGVLAYLKDGAIRAQYTAADGLGSGHIRDIQLDPNGAVWVSTEGGLSYLHNGRFATLTSRNGLPCDDVHWVQADDHRSLWLYMACGLVRMPLPELEAWTGVAREDPNRQIPLTFFDGSDGVRGHAATTGFSPSVARSADGRLWFLPWDGVSVVDPGNLPYNRVPPPVHIEGITADRKSYAAHGEGGRIDLPPLVRDLQIRYTALSLVVPEKVRFRYKLENWDQNWKDVGNGREATYGNLPPGEYRFRVWACNNSGVWNEAGTMVDISVAPMYYQTAWFGLSCGAALLLLLAALYRLRLKHLERQFNIRLDERLAERTRIAQELHDTLLQGFLSASLQVSVATDSLPAESQARSTLTRALQLMRQVIDEGRNAVRGLRSHESLSLDLEQAFSLVPREFAAASKTDEPGGFRVIVEGRQRPLHPLLRDNVYRIGREALINALRHSGADHIEVEIRYSRRQFCVVVRDDGCGIDPQILKAGRDGHWGLSGMGERANRIGAQLHLRSSPSAGTEVELSVPGHAAFVGHVKRRFLYWRDKPK